MWEYLRNPLKHLTGKNAHQVKKKKSKRDLPFRKFLKLLSCHICRKSVVTFLVYEVAAELPVCLMHLADFHFSLMCAGVFSAAVVL